MGLFYFKTLRSNPSIDPIPMNTLKSMVGIHLRTSRGWAPLMILLLLPILPLAPWWWREAFNGRDSWPYLIAPLVSILFLYTRRERIGPPTREGIPPFFVIGAGFAAAIMMIGYFTRIYYLAGSAYAGFLFFTVRIFWPPEQAKHTNFCILFLIFALPWSELVDQLLGFPLRMFTAKAAYAGFCAFHIPAVLEGTLVSTPNFSMDLIPACSGLTYTFALLYTSVILAALSQVRRIARILAVMATIPVAFLANVLRVFFIGLAGHFAGREVAERVFHDFGGFLFFALALIILFSLLNFLSVIFRPKERHL